MIQPFPSKMLKRRRASRNMKNDKIEVCRSSVLIVEKYSTAAPRNPIALEWKTVAQRGYATRAAIGLYAFGCIYMHML